MKNQRIYLYEDSKDVYIDAYICEKVDYYKRKAILVIPGGGYNIVCSDREGYMVANAFIPYGYNAFVLNYSVARKRVYPAQLIEASLAIKHIRDNAEEYGIDPEKVFATGFSAGGHLCAALGTMWYREEVLKAIPDMEYGYNKPTAIMPIYPVISGTDHPHIGSFQNLLGKDEPTKEELEYVSAERCVDEKSAPAFIAHSAPDTCVPVQNSIVFANAYANAKIPFTLHIFPNGPHGMALGTKLTSCGYKEMEQPDFAKWVEMAVDWAEMICDNR